MSVAAGPGDIADVSLGRYPRRRLHFQRWFRLLVLGSLLWGVSIAALALTGDRYIVPTVLLLGSFVVPIAWAVRVSDRGGVAEATPQLLVIAFLCGGSLGFLSSALLETPFVSTPRAPVTIGVGLVEEASKVLAVAW
jgi:RsiW-degrading membrane proteinase PrsW (M82 family)